MKNIFYWISALVLILTGIGLIIAGIWGIIVGIMDLSEGYSTNLIGAAVLFFMFSVPLLMHGFFYLKFARGKILKNKLSKISLIFFYIAFGIFMLLFILSIFSDFSLHSSSPEDAVISFFIVLIDCGLLLTSFVLIIIGRYGKSQNSQIYSNNQR